MTPQELKTLMEQHWTTPGCAQPLRPTCWEITPGGLQSYDDPFVLDQDDGDPLGAEAAG
jgi:hypothetical protein